MDASFVATLLRTSAEGFAGLAASRFWEEDAGSLGASGDGFGAWKAHLREQVLQLAAAVEDGSPALFAGHQAWLREAGSARGVTSDALQSACRHLAAVLQESLPEEGWALLPPHFEAGSETLAAPAPPSPSFLPKEGAPAELARGYLARIDEGDERGACDLLVDAVREERLTASQVMGEVLAPVLREVGRLWHIGELSIAEEHLTTVITRKALARLTSLTPRGASNGKTVVIGSVAGDNHDIGIQIVSAYFEMDGWRTICLGANTPAEDILQVSARFDADLIALGATLATQREAVGSTCALLREHRPSTPILVGGTAFALTDDGWSRLGAQAHAADPAEALAQGRRLVGL